MGAWSRGVYLFNHGSGKFWARWVKSASPRAPWGIRAAALHDCGFCGSAACGVENAREAVEDRPPRQGTGGPSDCQVHACPAWPACVFWHLASGIWLRRVRSGEIWKSSVGQSGCPTPCTRGPSARTSTYVHVGQPVVCLVRKVESS